MTSPAARNFEKVLRAFETRGINYPDVISRLRRLLAMGTSAKELLAVLRRRESQERLPEYARLEVLLLEEIEKESAPESATTLAADEPTGASATAGVVPEAPSAQSIAADLALRKAALREEAALRETEQLQAELRSARELLADRDAMLEQMRQALAERDGRIEGLTRERRILASALETRSKQTAERTTASTVELDTVRAALQMEQAKLRQAQNALAERDASLEQMQKALAERDAKIMARKTMRVEATAVAGSDLLAARAPAARPAPPPQPAPPAAAAPSAQRAPSAQPAQTAPTLRASPSAGRIVRPTRPLRRTLGWLVAAALFAALVGQYTYHTTFHSTQAPAPPTAGPPPPPGTVIRDCPTCPEMKVLPDGRFKQGSATGYSSAHLVHWVAVRRPIAMSTKPVTIEDFRQFITATGRVMRGCDTYDGKWKTHPDLGWDRPGFSQTSDEPVTCVSWNDAEAYAKWLSAKTGHHYRLPSASEWEYAARAGTDNPRPWGSEDRAACASANVADASAARRYPGSTVFPCDDGFVNTAPAGAFRPNSFGLNDMLGNVLQWTEDCWHDTYAAAPIDGSAWLDGDCSRHEVRGASWFSPPSSVRLDYRDRFPPDYRSSALGFRLVREIER